MSKEKIGTPLSGAGFTRGMLRAAEREAVLASFGGEGWIREVVDVIGDGKEATVYRCRADESVGVPWLAAKVYRADKFRAFRGARRYAGERGHRDARSARAMRRGTSKGRRMAHHEWVAWEWETLCLAHDAGAEVPEPLACTPDAILMEYLGDAEAPAPQLRHAEPDPATARAAFAGLLRSLEILLDQHRVHGDLSPYNLLWWRDRAWIIDLPQAVDARTHRDAYTLLCRDVANVERWFARFGVEAADRAAALWRRYRRGELGR